MTASLSRPALLRNRWRIGSSMIRSHGPRERSHGQYGTAQGRSCARKGSSSTDARRELGAAAFPTRRTFPPLMSPTRIRLATSVGPQTRRPEPFQTVRAYGVSRASFIPARGPDLPGTLEQPLALAPSLPS